MVRSAVYVRARIEPDEEDSTVKAVQRNFDPYTSDNRAPSQSLTPAGAAVNG